MSTILSYKAVLLVPWDNDVRHLESKKEIF